MQCCAISAPQVMKSIPQERVTSPKGLGDVALNKQTERKSRWDLPACGRCVLTPALLSGFYFSLFHLQKPGLGLDKSESLCYY